MVVNIMNDTLYKKIEKLSDRIRNGTDFKVIFSE